MARFVIADITDPRSVLQELQAIVPALPSVAVRLLKKKSEPEHGMLDNVRLYRSVVDGTYEYENVEEVIASIRENIMSGLLKLGRFGKSWRGVQIQRFQVI
jgi:hypothetical protein